MMIIHYTIYIAKRQAIVPNFDAQWIAGCLTLSNTAIVITFAGNDVIVSLIGPHDLTG